MNLSSMTYNAKAAAIATALSAVALTLQSCEQVDFDRVPRQTSG